jgi:hypothetical protein
MYEVKISFHISNVIHTLTIATFEQGTGEGQVEYARGKAIAFAKNVNPHLAVEVIHVEEEENPDRQFGLIYHRDASF